MSPRNKNAYFQGGGGVNEPPKPGEKKYPVEKAILMRPRFEEPLYYNYDYLDCEGVNGEPKYGPGSGWAHMNDFKSIKEFLEARRKRLKGKYVADDMRIEDTPKSYDERVDKMKVRACLLSRIIKTAKRECKDTDIEYTDRRDAYICGNCLHMGPNGSVNPKPTAKEFHALKNHNTDGIDWRDQNTDENDGPNFDYGQGLYQNMDKYDSVEDFVKHAPKGPGALMDNNDIDFPTDTQRDDASGIGSIIGDSETIESPISLGPSADGNPHDGILPGSVGLGDTTTYPQSNQLSGFMDKSLPQNDFEGKSPDQLDFGRDYSEEAEFPGILDEDDLQKLMKKYLTPAETDLFGLPDGIDPISDLDPEATTNSERPYVGSPDMGLQMYEDKWNI